MPEYNGVLVLAETRGDSLTGVSREAIGCGRKLADALNESLGAVFLGHDSFKASEETIRSGADNVFTVGNIDTETCENGFYTLLMEAVARQLNPRILLMGHTGIGRDVGPSLAFRLGTAATTDCVNLKIDPATKQLLVTRYVCGGNALAAFTSEICPNRHAPAKSFP